jgi:hypothetical protein
MEVSGERRFPNKQKGSIWKNEQKPDDEETYRRPEIPYPL